MSRSTGLIAFLLPIRLSSTTKTIPSPALRNASSSANTCSLVLRRGHDDIAELARERTAARDLQASEHVAIGFEQINARQRQPSNLGFILLLVAGLVAALLPLPQKLRPSLIRFANEDDVGKAFEDFRLDSRHGSANNDHEPPRPTLIKDLNQPTPLNAHAGQAHKIRPAETVEVDVLDILIDEHHLVMFGDKGSEQSEAGHGQVGALPE